MAAVPSSAEGGTPLTHEIPTSMEIRGNKNAAEAIAATVEIRAVGEVTPSSSVPAQTSDQPLDQQQQQQNESRPVVIATPAPQPTMMSRSPTNTITNTNQVQETSPFRSPRSVAPSTDPDGQTLQELQQTERVYN